MNLITNVLKTTLICFLFVNCLTVFAAKEFVAEVVKIDGKVTQLRPGALTASLLRLNDQLQEDTSIVTSEKSFVRVRFFDGSSLSIGPNSKAVINSFPKNDTGIITLLNGQLRAEVTKSNADDKQSNGDSIAVKDKSKLIVKTRSAAMGVRGTDFQTGYNSTNKITSLLTYVGNVRMNKLNVDSGRREDSALFYGDDPKKLDTEINSKAAVDVERGQFSNVSDKTTNVTIPIQISPVQFTVLYKNSDLVQHKDEDAEKKELKDIDLKEWQVIKGNKQKVPPEGVFDKQKKQFAAKAGGFLDFTTGQYIPPTSESNFDSQNGVYVPKDQGYIDSKTGQYFPPKGMKVDPLKGVVLDDKVKLPELEKRQLLAKVEEINLAMGHDFIVKGDASQIIAEKNKFIRLSTKEEYSKNTLELTFGGYSETMAVSDSSDSRLSNRDYEAESGNTQILKWKMASDNNWRPLIKFKHSSIDYGKKNSFTNDGNNLFSMGLGTEYYLNSKIIFNFGVRFEQSNYFDNVGDPTVPIKIVRVTIPKFFSTINYLLFEKNRWFLDGNFGAELLMPKESGELSTSTGLGLNANMFANFYITSRLLAKCGFELVHERGEIETASSKYSINRNSQGFKLAISSWF